MENKNMLKSKSYRISWKDAKNNGLYISTKDIDIDRRAVASPYEFYVKQNDLIEEIARFIEEKKAIGPQAIAIELRKKFTVENQK